MTEVLLISGRRPSLPGVASLAEHLNSSGFTVRVAFAADPDDPKPRDLAVLDVAETRRLRMSLTGRREGAPLRRLSTPWGRVVARNAAVRAWSRVAGPARKTWLLAKYDPWLRRVARRSDIILAADRDAMLAARRAGEHNPASVVLPIDDPRVEEMLVRARATIPLQRLLRTGSVSGGLADVVTAWAQVEAAPDDLYLRGFVSGAVKLVQALRRHGAFEVAEIIADSALVLGPPDQVGDRLRLERTTLRISQGEHPRDLPDAVRGVMAHADEALRAGRMDDVAEMTLDVVDAMFNRELHADVLYSPLVADPAAFLAPLYDSLTHRVLGAPAGSMGGVLSTGGHPLTARSRDAVVAGGRLARDERSDRVPAQSPRRPHRLLVVPGDYPHFTKGIIGALREDADVDLRVLHLREAGAPPRRHHRPTLVADRLSDAVGRPVPQLGARDIELLGWADTIFVDWCDNAAQWTALHAPPHARLVIRFHSLEAISHQPHMIDWTRVSDVIFVGHHVRQLVERAVPRLATSTRIHVVPNEMRLERFGLPKRAGAERTIAMVGWAQRVKDPLWALDVLARLRAADPRWRLLLMGHDFSAHQHRGALRYRDRFRSRAAEDDVRDGVTYAGYTSDLPEALRDAGFILSASRREGFPVGLTEGAASGAVPVIRDWPMYASYEGARGIFPPDWVVDSPDEAAARMLAHADARERTEAGEAARSFVVERYDWPVVEPRFREVLFGEAQATAGPATAGPATTPPAPRPHGMVR